MSLLDRANEDVIIFMEEMVLDAHGNKKTRPSATGIPYKARLQVQGQSGTSSRRQEQDNEGFSSEKVYNMRLPRSWPHGELGAQSQVSWRGQIWAVFGDVNLYNGSRNTRHNDYTLKRY